MTPRHDSYWTWVAKLYAVGKRPLLEILEFATLRRRAEREAFWIGQYRATVYNVRQPGAAKRAGSHRRAKKRRNG